MDKSYHNLLMINHALFQKKVLNKLIKIGLTSGQPKILNYLSLHDGSIQKDIAFGCQIDPATLTGILERMEEKGLVERRIVNGNRRSSYVFLTHDGKKYSKIVTDTFIQMEEEVFKNIDKNEKEQILNLLYKLCCNMTDTEEFK